MDEGERLDVSVNALTDQLRRNANLWWGKHPEHDWVVLDRADPRNRDGETRLVVRCRDWSTLRVSLEEFGSNLFQWFLNHVRSLPSERQQLECLSTLCQFEAEFCSRRVQLRELTEADWLSGPVPLLLAHAAKLPWGGDSGFWADAGRKQLLLACAIARIYWSALVPRLRKAVEALETAADDPTKKRTDPPAVEPASLEDWIVATITKAGDWPARRTSMADLWGLFLGAWGDISHPNRRRPLPSHDGWGPLIHDVFGNPFRPVAIDPSWLLWKDATVPRLAKAIYDERRLPQGTLDPTRLAILGDALEEAGCGDPEVLSHLRGAGTHVRGCWVLDLLFGKK